MGYHYHLICGYIAHFNRILKQLSFETENFKSIGLFSCFSAVVV